MIFAAWIRCVGGCLNETDVTLLQNASAAWDIDGYCPRFDCLGGDEASGDCLSDDTAAVLTEVNQTSHVRHVMS